MAKKKNKKYVYETCYEPVCECINCNDVHLRKDRVKFEYEKSEYLCVYICPKCGNLSYAMIGEEPYKVRRYNND